MKKREITNNELEQLFTNIIEQEPLLTEYQVDLMLNNLPEPIPGNALKSFFINHLNIFLLSATIVMIITVVLIWINSDNQREEVSAQNSQEKNVVAPVTADTITAKPAIIINKEISQNKANEDTVLIDFDTKARTAIVQTETAISLSDVYKHFEKRPQVFSIRTNRDTTIICKEGTMIQINANSFVSEKTGNPISETVQLVVKEYYKISDMILANLTTTSGGKILETGGMLHISVTNNRENCILKPGSEIKTGFPFSGKKDDMDLFYGEQTNNIINWKLANKADDVKIDDELRITVSPERESNSEVFFIVEDMLEFPGGDLAMRRFLIENGGYPSTMLNKEIEGKVMVTFVVDSDGNTTNIRVVEGLDETLDKVAVYVVSNFPKWKPGRQRGRPVAVSYTIPVAFSAKKGELTIDEIDKANKLEEKLKSFKYDNESAKYLSNSDKIRKFEEKIENENFKETSAFEVNRYLFSTTRLGWLNCDRFLKENRKLTDLFIMNENSDNTIVNVIFHRFKSLIPGSIESEKIVFRNIPEGEKVTIVAIKAVESKILFSVTETTVTEKKEVTLDFQQVTLELLKKEMEKLNKFHK
jgi:TonB family protein